VVQIKDLILGAELASLEKDRDEYLKKQAEAQFSCGEDEMVDKVKDLLKRRGVMWN
jgi:histidyl-tRNA synthetase